MLNIIAGCIFVILCYIFDWLFACGIIKLITLCFSLKFSWLVSTGIWLIVRLLRTYFTK